MSIIKTKLRSALEKFAKSKDSKLPLINQIKRYYIEFQNDLYGRTFMGADKYGNKYYQECNHFGMPTKRIVMHNTEFGFKFRNDPHFNAWLHRQVELPPTQEQLQILYLKDEARKQAAIQYDAVESRMMTHFREFTKLLETNKVDYCFPKKTEQKLLEGSRLPVMFKKEKGKTIM